MKDLKWLIGGGVLVACLIAFFSLGLKDQLVYFYQPDEVVGDINAHLNKNIRVGAMVEEGSMKWQPQELILTFTATDYKGSDFEVTYKGSPPDLFKEGQGVVVEGQFKSSETPLQFEAHRLMVKHSEEYKKPDATQSMNKELLQKSLFKQ